MRLVDRIPSTRPELPTHSKLHNRRQNPHHNHTNLDSADGLFQAHSESVVRRKYHHPDHCDEEHDEGDEAAEEKQIDVFPI
jgi:hypothetical protein